MPHDPYPESQTAPDDQSDRASEARACKCPRCDGDLIRIRRRPIDRLLSLFVSLRRFQCTNPGCNWNGNLRKDRYMSGSGPVTAY